MQWSEIRQQYPGQWLLIEALEARSDNGWRILDDMQVVQSFPDVKCAWERYKELNRADPCRELYLLHTDREQIEIAEVRSLGLRMAS